MKTLYTDLLIKVIADTIYGSGGQVMDPDKSGETTPYSRDARLTGLDWPSVAHSMAGVARLTNLRDLSQRALDENVPGDFIEAGVWRGGCCILMKGVLAANGVTDRTVYVADSFEGLPKPDAETYPADAGDRLHAFPQLAIGQAQVEANFAAYDLLDERVTFVKGMFSDTLPTLDAGPFALIRLDGDMYESTMVSLEALYPKLSPGGFIIVDDYVIPQCRQAVQDYRQRHGIRAAIHEIDWTGVWWQKPLQEETPQIAARPAGNGRVSVVVVAYDIARELPRTLHSLSPQYQRGVTADDYEVIVVDNGSSIPVSEEAVSRHGPNFRLIRIDDASPSPAAAINRGIAAAQGDKIGVMIDGARIVTPGLVRFARAGLDMWPTAVVVAPGWYLGNDVQGNAARNGYTREVEDGLLAAIQWPEDGYRLFEIGTMDESSVDPWFSQIAEANALFLSRENWQAIGGMDERYAHPGGGLVNLDALERAMELPEAKLIATLGEATFHQFHGGVSTNTDVERQAHNWTVWKDERDRIRGLTAFTFHQPREFVGALPPAVVPHIARAAITTRRNVAAAVAGGFRAELKAPAEPVAATGATAQLEALAKVQFEQGRYHAAADIMRLVARHAPADLARSRLFSTASMLSREPGPRDADHFVALGDAHRALGEADAAAQHYRQALDVEPDTVAAHVGLADLRMTGPFYYDWLERLYTEFKPGTVIEIGVYNGLSLSKLTAPTMAIAIDPSPKASVTLSAETHVFPETSDAFFARGGADALMAGRRLGFGFIDGLHTFEQVLRDFANLERHCGPGSVLLLHDTAPLDEPTQAVPPATQFHTGDVWKIVPALTALRPDLDAFTIATPWTGLTVVTGFGHAARDPSWIATAADRFGGMAFAELERSFEDTLRLVPNSWEPVLARLRASGVGADHGPR